MALTKLCVPQYKTNSPEYGEKTCRQQIGWQGRGKDKRSEVTIIRMH